MNEKWKIGDVNLTGCKITDANNIIKAAWVVDENDNKIWVWDIPLYVRNKKLKKIINKL